MTVPTIQIYTMQSVAEAKAVTALGIDRIGVTPAERGLPGEISTALAAAIADEVRGQVTVSALTVDTDLDGIAAMVSLVRADVLHLCGPPGAVSPEDVTTLKGRLPGVQIMQAIAVVGGRSIADAVDYSKVADSLILDSVAADVEGVGAAGVVHDWTISRRIVEEVTVPVILAGGLSVDNVGAAVAAVGPWGVDSLTFTNRPLPGGGFEKDLDLVTDFAVAARAVGIPRPGLVG